MFDHQNIHYQINPERHHSRQLWHIYLAYKWSKILWGLCLSLLLFSELTAAVSAASLDSTQNCVMPPSDMVAWWSLDEETGPTAGDLTGQANGGEYISNPVPVTGFVGGALSFNGIDQYLRVADSSDFDFDTGMFTFAGWIYHSIDTSATLIEKWDSTTNSGYRINLVPVSGGSQLALVLGGNNYSSDALNATMTYDQWHYVAISVQYSPEDEYVTFYVDGETTGQFATSTSNVVSGGNILDNASPLTIGGTDNFFGGKLDELTFFNRVLVESELDAIFEANSAGQCKPTSTIEIPQQQITPGNTFTVSVIAELKTQIAAATIKVSYDPVLFRPVDCRMDSQNLFSTVNCNLNFEPSAVRLNAVSIDANGIVGSVHVADLFFEHVGPIQISSTLMIDVESLSEPEGNSIDFTTIDGVITIKDIDSEIRGSVWSDENANGIRDTGEPGIEGVPARLQGSSDCSALSIATTTDANGEYAFSSLDLNQSYFVMFEPPANTKFSLQDVSDNDTIDSDVHPNTGQTDLINIPMDSIDAGVVDQTGDDIGRIIGTIYEDNNGNGIQEEEEFGICGVTVNLLDEAGGVFATTTSDADGNYSFVGLDINQAYAIQVVLPDNLNSSVGNSEFDTNNESGFIILSESDNSEVSIDFGTVPDEIVGDTLDCTGKGLNQRLGKLNIFGSPAGDGGIANRHSRSAQIYPGIIEGTIWNDTLNENGMRDASDGVTDEGIWVVCTCAEGFFDPEVDKDKQVLMVHPKNGKYRFKSLNLDGKYVIKALLSGNKKLTQGESADLDGDSDLDQMTRESGRLNINSNDNKIKINIGLVDVEIGSGDVNCDGAANAPDGLWILQSVVGFRESDTACPRPARFDISTRLYGDVCDVDGNSTCDDLDALRILRCAIGIRTAPCPQNLVSASANNGRSREESVDKTQSVSNTIEIASQQVIPGSTFMVPLIATVDQVLGTAVIDVIYDASQLEIVSCQVDKDGRFGIGECNMDQKGKISLGLLLGSGVEKVWHLADITFKHRGTSQASNTLEINVQTLTDIHGNPLLHTTLDSEVNVGYWLYLPKIKR